MLLKMIAHLLLDELPKFLTDSDPVVRATAKERFDELEGSGDFYGLEIRCSKTFLY